MRPYMLKCTFLTNTFISLQKNFMCMKMLLMQLKY